MDHIDVTLLAMLQQNARTPIKVMTENVYLSSPAVSARIDKLEKQGFITGYTADVNPMKIGYRITAYINLEMSPKRKQEFYPFIRACPNVLECNCVTGPYSMLIKAAYPSTVELDSFIGQLQRFGNTSTQIVFSTSVQPRGIDVEQAASYLEQG